MAHKDTCGNEADAYQNQKSYSASVRKEKINEIKSEKSKKPRHKLAVNIQKEFLESKDEIRKLSRRYFPWTI